MKLAPGIYTTRAEAVRAAERLSRIRARSFYVYQDGAGDEFHIGALVDLDGEMVRDDAIVAYCPPDGPTEPGPRWHHR